MEARYIVLIAVMYVLSISMVSSQEINGSPYTKTYIKSRSTPGSASTSATMIIIATTITPTTIIETKTATTTTTINRFCDRDEGCLVNGYCDNSYTCKLKYQWVHFTPELENDHRLVRTGGDAHPFANIRLLFENGDKVPYEGLFIARDKTISSVNTADNDSDYALIEVLLMEHGKAKWVPSSNGTILNNAIEGGLRNKEMLYMCRIVDINKFHHGGYMQPSNHSCCVHNFGMYFQTYELLVHEI